MGDRELKASLDFMGFVNRFFGGTRTVLRFLEKASPPKRFTALDIGCGGGDVPAAVARWARKKGLEASITAIDLNERCLRYASEKNADPAVRYLAHSAFDVESLGPFDYVFSSMFFHHLSDEEITSLLGAMRRQSRLGYLVNDLLRSPAAHLGATALSALAFDKTVYNDARLSVRRAFTPEDFERYRDVAAPEARVARRPLFRVALYHA